MRFHLSAELISFIVSLYVTCLCVIFSISAGLYHLSLLAEEYNHVARKVVRYLIYGSSVYLLYSWIFMGFSFSYVLLPAISKYLYYIILIGSPILNFASPKPLAATVLLVINCFRFFRFHRNQLYSSVVETIVYLFTVELLPFFALLTTLSVNAPLLPGSQEEDEVARSHRVPLVVNLLRKVSSVLLEKLNPLLVKLNLSQRGGRRFGSNLVL
ncbi:hypothetical protein RCL1_006735 [Eukaryota sp. TZLM3-RCL]